MSNINKQAAKMIKEGRKAKQLSQADIAKHLVCSQSIVSKLENNRLIITLDILKKLTEILDIEVCELFD